MAADLNRASERGVAAVFARLAPDLAADDWLRIFRIWSIIAELACSRVVYFQDLLYGRRGGRRVQGQIEDPQQWKTFIRTIVASAQASQNKRRIIFHNFLSIITGLASRWVS